MRARTAGGWTLVVIVAILGGLQLAADRSVIDLLVNSDALLPASLFWDLQHHGYAWRGFELQRSPSIVPDLLFYGLVQLTTGSWRLASLSFVIAALFGFALAAGFISHSLERRGAWLGAAAFLLLAAPILWLELPLTLSAQHVWALIPGFHGGPFLLAIVALAVARDSAERTGLGSLAALMLLVVLGTLSDKLFVITCVGPLAVAVGWATLDGSVRRIRAGQVLSTSIAGAAIGWWLNTVVRREPDLVIRWPHVWENARSFVASPTELVRAGPWRFGVEYLLPMAAVAWLLTRRRTSAATWWYVTAITGMLGSAIVAGVLYADFSSYRYLAPLLWWPVILAAVALARWGDTFVFGGLAALALVLVGAGAAHELRGPALLSWHSPFEKCLLDGQRSGELKAGLSNYWYSRQTVASSEWSIHLDQINRNGSATWWGNDRYWFVRDFESMDRLTEYNYILMKQLDEPAIRAHFGPPTRVVSCGEDPIWVYDDSAALTRRFRNLSVPLYATFLESGQSVCVPADRVYAEGPSAGRLKPVFRSDSEHRDVQWGPPVELPAGSWKVSMMYRLTTESPGGDRWQIQDGPRTVFDGPLPPTEASGIIEAVVSFTQPTTVSLRATLAGRAEVTLEHIAVGAADTHGTSACDR
jgi:hypothetical protein